MEELKELFKAIDKIIKNALIDYNALLQKEIDSDFLEDVENRRLANSFLFYFAKLQDKIGVKLFKKVLYELQEIDSFAIPFRDVLDILEKLEIIEADEWLKIREIRNELSHEYPDDIDESIESLKLAINFFPNMLNIYQNLKEKIEKSS
ncbi:MULTISPECIES: hypothetical protein [unclassified Lebetimonas]|uniref:hypothetical protein n=1 Tax=unclassified Lebetimonas TaxID=2648158 RepID=UPI000466E5CE|nr:MULTISPECIES: hypothetical protein [unclassified Lebetimonas]